MSRSVSGLNRRTVLAAAPLALWSPLSAFAQTGNGQYQTGDDLEVEVPVPDGTEVGLESELLGQSTKRTVRNGRIAVGSVKKAGAYAVRVIYDSAGLQKVDLHAVFVLPTDQFGTFEVAVGNETVPKNQVPKVKQGTLAALANKNTYTDDRLSRALAAWVRKDLPGQAAGAGTVFVTGTLCVSGVVPACPLLGAALGDVGATAIEGLTGRLLDVLAEDRVIAAADAAALKGIIGKVKTVIKVARGAGVAAVLEDLVFAAAEVAAGEGAPKWVLQCAKGEVDGVRLYLKLMR